VTSFLTHQLPGRTVLTQNAEHLWFSGTDYLGMAHNEAFRSYLQEGLSRYGMHFGSSRNGSLRLAIYEEAEMAFAAFTQFPSALLVSSGMWAGQLVMKEIENIIGISIPFQSIQYHYAPKVHPALWGKDYLSNKQSWNDWATETITRINESEVHIAHIICTDAIGSPLVEAFDFSVFNQIKNIPSVWMIIDESHSLGVLGSNGTGIADEVPQNIRNKTLFISSLNKALGIPGGAIYGSQEMISTIRRSPWFTGASPTAPAYIFAFNQLLAENIYINASKHLKKQVSYFIQKSRSSTMLMVEGYPVFCSQNPELFESLLHHGIMASRFSYPSPTDPPITRIAISTLHKKEDLDHLAEVCLKYS
jgi:8-amino-7-oxononanoate synthase